MTDIGPSSRNATIRAMRSVVFWALVVAILVAVFMGTRYMQPPSDEPAPSPLRAGQLVDLSHAYDEQTIFWPTAAEGFQLHKDADGVTPAGFYYAANSFS